LSLAAALGSPALADDEHAMPDEEIGDSIAMLLSSGAPTQYLFRGLPQSDRGFIWQANANLDVALYDSPQLQLIIPVGFWLSLHPGDKATSGRGPAAWYESRMSGGLALASPAFRADARFAVYSSPNGSFRDVYELLLTAELRDDVLWTTSDPEAVFRGFFPSLTLAQELEGARDGAGEGTFADLRLSPRLRLLSSASWTIEVALPVALGLSLNDYYELPTGTRGSRRAQSLGYASAAIAADIFPRFVARRLGLYAITPSLELLLPRAARDLPGVDTLELVARIDSSLRF
jgi:hypothetical protein